MKLHGSTKNEITKDKNGESLPHLEITAVVLTHSQPGRNIPGIFAECFISVAMFGTSSDNLGTILNEKIF